MVDSSQAELDRSPAQFFFEIGFAACWAEAFIRAGEKPPFELTDALIEHAWSIAGEAHDDHEEFDRYLALANNRQSDEGSDYCTCAYGAQGAPVDDRCPIHGLPSDDERAAQEKSHV